MPAKRAGPGIFVRMSDDDGKVYHQNTDLQLSLALFIWLLRLNCVGAYGRHE